MIRVFLKTQANLLKDKKLGTEVPFLVNRQIVMWKRVVGAWNDNKQVAKSKLTVRNKFHQF